MIKNAQQLKITEHWIKFFTEEKDSIIGEGLLEVARRDAADSMIEELKGQVRNYISEVTWLDIFTLWQKAQVSQTIDGLQHFLDINYETPKRKI